VRSPQRTPAGRLHIVAAATLMLGVVACSASGPEPSGPSPTSASPTSASPTSASPTSASPTGATASGATASGHVTASGSAADRPDRPPPVLHGGVTVGEGCAARVLAGLSPAERAGQVLMIGVPVDAPATAAATVLGYRPGGVFLHGRSRRSAAEIGRQVGVLQRVARSQVALHVAVDQEGGQVQTLSGSGFGAIPSALVQGRWDADHLTAEVSRWTAGLRAGGVTVDFAPVADTVPAGTEGRNPPIGAVDRQYGADPRRVAQAVSTVVAAIQAGGVLATLKHFPGLGRVGADTDRSDRAVDPVTTADDPHLLPFRAGIASGAAVVMLSSARYPKLDSRNPATFSPALISLLRSDLGFDGLVVSDDLGSAGAVSGVPVGRRAVDFVAAGGDLVLTVRPGDVNPMRAALITRAAASTDFRRALDRAALDVLASKSRAGLLSC